MAGQPDSPRFADCPKFAAAMEILSRPWNGLIISALTERPHRFGEISERLQPIGDRILSQRLKALEARGLVERRVLAGPPVRVEYTLTSGGHGFAAVEKAIRAWAESAGPQLVEAPKKKSGKARRARAAR